MASRTYSKVKYQPAHWLVVGPHRVWTTLTADDLENPKLWTLRSPAAWAEAVALTQEKAAPPSAKKGTDGDRPERGAVTGGGFNRRTGY
jgi:hypothetical protein